MGELRKLSPTDLTNILADHMEWLSSGCRRGKKANLSRTNLNGRTLSGANLYKAVVNNASLESADLARADLSGVELYGTSLKSANLPMADLSGVHTNWATDFSGANLCEAKLIDANLCSVRLGMTDLRLANLNRADLSGANLHDANLSGAELSWTDFSRAEMSGANLQNSRVRQSKFTDLDLSSTCGLEAVQHEGPSSVGIDTLFKSKGLIPDAFLEGCGVPRVMRDYAKALVNAANLSLCYESCFISYSSVDEALAQRLHDGLRRVDVRVWFAPEDIKDGEWIDERIDNAIGLHDRLLLIISEASLKSGWVRREIRRAIDKERKTGKRALFPIRLVDIDVIHDWDWLDHKTGENLAEYVTRYKIPDFREWKDEAKFRERFNKLVAGLNKGDLIALEDPD